MKNVFSGQKFLLVGASFCLICPAWAQPGMSPYYKAPESFAGRTIVIPTGTTFEGRIESTIGSTMSKQGERFTITISSPLLANGSDVLIPAGAEITGEVVQAIPASQVPHAKHEKSVGKLRVQITALKMPNGMTYPMVASIVGEDTVQDPNHMYNQFNNAPPSVRGSGVAYVGTPTGFESIAPGKARYGRNGAVSVMTKNDMYNDPIMGQDKSLADQKKEIRSLVKKKRNLYIYNGSPLTIRLDAPFKIGMCVSAAEESTLGIHPSSINSAPPSKIITQPINNSQKAPLNGQRNNQNNNSQDSNF